ncbi:right-handed parallel beta-helix repeat-containing protein, partial [Candidatus Dependentiae bacterium]|nr:right-handed parallel beta-helix repeat-containing protein [Candidatus Dependentiae bacterium]
MTKLKVLLIISLCLIFVVIFNATYTVTNTNAFGFGTLRQAIIDSNANVGSDTIVFSVSGTITLFTDLPTLSDTTGGTIIDAGVNHDVIINGGSLVSAGITITSANNVVSGLVINNFNTSEILITGSDATNNQIRNCYLGTNSSGTGTGSSINFNGIYITDGASSNVIGGSNPGDRNLISGNQNSGVRIESWTSPCNDNQIIGNYIGTDVNGTASLGNGSGVLIRKFGSNNQITNNLISGNDLYGINLYTSPNTIVKGNLIGTDVNGTSALPNLSLGIFIAHGSFGNVIGGLNPEDRNIISGNDGEGIRITNYTTGDEIIIIGNYIGTDITGINPLGNTSHGIRINDSLSSITIGGIISGHQNIIANNSEDGISFTGTESTHTSILPNKFYNNGDLGIDLGNDGVTLNDANDSDTGPNGLKNFPVITALYQTGVNEYQVYGTAAPNDEVYLYRVTDSGAGVTEDPTGYGEGFEYLAMTTADTNGDFSFSGLNITEVPVLSSVAIDGDGNTSEFGQNYSTVETVDVVTVNAVGRAPANAQAGDADILMQEMEVFTNANTASWTLLRIDMTGTGTDTDVAAVRLYLDDGDDTFEPGTDTEIGSGVFSSGTVTLNITDQEITTSAKTYFITFDLTVDAVDQHTVGTRLDNA